MDPKQLLMVSGLMFRCPGITSVPLPSGDVFQTFAWYPVLIIPTEGIVVPVTVVTEDNVPGTSPIPPLLLNANEYWIGIHSGYNVTAVPFENMPSMNAASTVTLPMDNDVPDDSLPVFHPAIL